MYLVRRDTGDDEAMPAFIQLVVRRCGQARQHKLLVGHSGMGVGAYLSGQM